MLLDDHAAGSSRPGRLRADWKIIAVVAIVGAIVLCAFRFVIFLPQSVVIEKVETLCYGISPSRGDATELSANCESVQKFVDEKPRYRRRNWYLDRSIYASFRYRSPADGKVYTGRIQRHNNDLGDAINVGDKIVVYFSRLSAESYTDLRNTSRPE